jgi:hypothetical protein
LKESKKELISRVYQFHPWLEQGANKRTPKPFVEKAENAVGVSKEPKKELISRVYQFHPQLDQGANKRTPKPFVEKPENAAGVSK